MDKKLNRKNFSGLLILFLLWPFGALLYAVQSFKRKESRYIIYFYIIFFGFTFVVGGNKLLDSYRYAEYFKNIAFISYSGFFSTILSHYLISKETLDLANPIISFIVSRITNNYHLFFAVIAAIFGYFYLKSINIVYKIYEKNKHFLSLLLLLYFVTIINPVFNINGFRFWTATWIFFLGAYQLITTGQKKYLFLCLLSMLFHFTFIIPNFILLLYLFIGNRKTLYLIFAIISFFLSKYFIQLLPNFLNYFSLGINEKAMAYTNYKYIESVTEHLLWAEKYSKWYLYLPQKLTFYYIVFSFSFISYKSKKYLINKELSNLYSFSLLFFGFANMMSYIPSMGRFLSLFYLLAIAFIMHALVILRNKNFNWLAYSGIVPFILSLIVVLRLAIDIINPWIFTLIPFPLIFHDISIYNWVFK